MQRANISERFPLNSPLPHFSLKNVTGEFLGTEYLTTGKAALVVFTCNHCPYVRGTEAMLHGIVARFAPMGLRTVTINSNDPTTYPEDSFEKMQSKARDLKLPYPYLWDADQSVAKLFDAACTPECYLFDGNQKLVFHGAITDLPKEPGKPRADLLSPAIEAVIRDELPKTQFAHPLGCSIKWKVA